MTKKFKFNIIDLIIVVFIIAAVALFCVKFLGGSDKAPATENTSSTVRITLYVEESPAYVPSHTEIGDPSYDLYDKMSLGTVVDIQVDEAVMYVETADGQLSKTTKEDYCSVTIVTELVGANMTGLGIPVADGYLASGHTVTFYAGEGKYFGKVMDIEVIG